MFMTWTKFCIFGNCVCHSLTALFLYWLFNCDVYFNTHGSHKHGLFSIGVSPATLVFSLNWGPFGLWLCSPALWHPCLKSTPPQ